MLEGLKELIRNLAFILLLATFLEMLLPSKSMQGFVKLVMGLFVIAAIMNPLSDFLKIDFRTEVPAWIEVSSNDLPVLAAEGETQDTGKTAVREQYKKILISQIRVLVSAIDGVKDTEIDVELDQLKGGFSDYPQILKVNILFSQQSGIVSPVKPVIIGEDKNEEKGSESAKAKEIKKQIASLMQIPETIIVVKEKI